MRLGALLLPVILLAAGCLGAESPGPAPAAAGPGAGLGAPAGPATLNGTVVLADLPMAREVTWTNGSFEARQNGRPLGLLARTAGVDWDNRIEVDVGARFPEGLPTRLIVEVNTPLEHGDFDLGVGLGGNEFWTGDWDTPYGGYSRIDAILVRRSADPIVVRLAYDDVEPAASVPYALRIETITDPGVLAVALPYAVSLVPGARIALDYLYREPIGPTRPPAFLLVFGPDDALLARTALEERAEFAVPADGAAGEYVLYVTQGSGAVRLSVLSSPQPVAVRLLAGPVTTSEPQTVPPGAEGVAWTFEVERPPLLAGLFSARGPLVGTQGHVRMSSPAGEIFRFGGEMGALLLPGTGADSGYGHEALVAGTYEVEAGFGREVGPEGSAFVSYVRHYQR